MTTSTRRSRALRTAALLPLFAFAACENGGTAAFQNGTGLLPEGADGEKALPQAPLSAPVQNAQGAIANAPASADQVPHPSQQPEALGLLAFKVNPFANMETGYQATNRAFRAFLRDNEGHIVAAGPMDMRAAMDGSTCFSATGDGYPCLELHVRLKHFDASLREGSAEGETLHGALSVCMVRDDAAEYDLSECRNLGGSAANGDRPAQWLDRPVTFTVDSGGKIVIHGYGNSIGHGGNALSLFHPAFAFAAPGMAFKDFQSPLVLDLSGKGSFDLTSADEARPVRFDLQATGEKVQTGWIGPRAAFLAIDLNRDGRIESGAELFGEYSAGGVALPGELRTFANGFAALAQYDGNKDGKIDRDDHVFPKLRFWRDANGNGRTDKDELVDLTQAGIVELGLSYSASSNSGRHEMAAGNEIRLVSTYKTKDGKEHRLGDVWFKQRRTEGPSASAAGLVPPMISAR